MNPKCQEVFSIGGGGAEDSFSARAKIRLLSWGRYGDVKV